MSKYLLALDQGTTSSRCIIFDRHGMVCSKVQREFGQIFPRDGWVEHDADEIFAKTTTGKITGTLLTAKDFSACRSDTGSIRVPATDGTKCELVTDTGNIKIEISK